MKPKVAIHESPRKMNAGCVCFQEITPKCKTEYFAGSQIAMPQITATGSADNSNIYHGRITASGLAANRTTCEPFDSNKQEIMGFPLTTGTFVRVRKVCAWRVSANELGCNSWDIIDMFPADNPPDWAKE